MNSFLHLIASLLSISLIPGASRYNPRSLGLWANLRTACHGASKMGALLILATVGFSSVARAAPAYPYVEDTAHSVSSTNLSSHVVVLPPSIEAGDLLIMFLGFRDDVQSVNVPAGWTALLNDASGAGNGQASIFYRVANGTEGATQTVTTPQTGRGAFSVYRIRSGTYKGVPTVTANNIASSASPNPPNHTPAGGNNAYLWIAGAAGTGTGNANRSVIFPANYTGVHVKSLGSGTPTSTASVTTGRRFLVASSENPAAFTNFVDSISHRSFTVAVEGADYLVVSNPAPVGPTVNGIGATITITRQNANESPLTGAALTVDLTAAAPGIFHSTPTLDNPITQVSIGAGNASTTVYFTSSVPGTYTVGATATGFTGGSAAAVIQPSIGLNSPPTIVNTGPRAAYVVTRAPPYTGPLTVTLSDSPAAGTFYDAAVAGSPITQVIVADGDASAPFWFNAAVAGTYSVTASAPLVPDAQHQLEVLPGSTLNNSTITASPSSFLTSGSGTSIITVQLKDEFNNNLTSSGGLVTLLASGGTLSAVVDNTDGTYTATFTESGTGTTVITGFLGSCPLAGFAEIEVTTLPVFDANYAEINIGANGVLTSGDAGEPGAVYRFTNIITIGGQQIDMDIVIEDRENVVGGASGFVFDNNGSNIPRFQPEIHSSAADGYMEFTLRFLANEVPVSLRSFFVSAVDIDGSASTQEYLELTGFTSYALDAATQIVVSPGQLANSTRFRGRASTLAGIVFDNTCTVLARYEDPISVLRMRAGNTGNPGDRRLFSVQFGVEAGAFSNPDVTTALIAGPSSIPGAAQTLRIVPEGTINVHQFTLVTDPPDPDPDWFIDGGPDAARFSINQSTGMLSFNVAPVFAAPVDANTDNDYEVTIRVERSVAPFTSSTQQVKVRVIKLPLLTITADPKQKYVGDLDPPLTYTYEIDDPDVAACAPTVIFSGTLGRVAGETAGTYEIQLATLNAPGYDVVYVPADLDILEFFVSSPTVNEASSHAIFEVKGLTGWTTELALIAGGTATVAPAVGQDYGAGLEYFNGTIWVTYTPGDDITLLDTSGGNAHLLVRTPIYQDAVHEVSETFLLRATNQDTIQATGTGTIVDEGNGNLYFGPNTTGTPDVGDPEDYDDDRPLSVNSVTVNEASPYAVFQVTGAAGQLAGLALDSVSATLGVDFAGAPASGLQAYINSAWVDYDAATWVEIPAAGTLLVRTPILPDTINEGAETFTLTATNTGNSDFDGTGTIIDNGTGSLFLGSNTTGAPNAPVNAYDLDDDRPLTVSNTTVNEASPFAIFSVGGVDDQWVQLSLAGGTATLVDDFGFPVPALQVLVSGVWEDYTPGDFVQLDGATLLVRTPIVNDTIDEGPHQFTLTATNTGGTGTAGTGTINDHGAGSIFLGANITGTPDVGDPEDYDDDRPLAVNDVTVNEASPYAVFKVDGLTGRLVSLDLLDGVATQPADFGNLPVSGLQIFDGSNWVDYVAGTFVEIPAGWAAVPAGNLLLVRTPIVNDATHEVSEDFTLRAFNTGTLGYDGTGTIVDEGNGDVFTPGNEDGDPNDPGDPGYPVPLDDDRPFAVNNITVNEASDYAVFTITGDPALDLTLVLAGNTATLDTDFGGAVDLQYYDGANWVDYVPASTVTIDGTGVLLVRTPIINDTTREFPHETFTLAATGPGPFTSTGTGTIADDGTGVLFLGTNTSGTPDAPANPYDLDDDRPLTVSSVTVNEASPYAVFTVGGADDQFLQLSTASGTATLDLDFGDTVDPDLQYFDGADWVDYTPGDFVQMDGTTLLVRIAIINDTFNEVSETFTVTATNTGGTGTAGTGTIVDQGNGVIFLPDNETDTPNVDTDPGYPDALDDDRPLTVTGGTYNEASPYGVFSVDGAVGQLVSLDLLEDEAIEPEDYGTDVATTKLEVLVTGVWTAYEVGDLIAIPAGGTLLVRTAINNDTINEVSEDFALQATNVGGTDFTGTGTIVDQGDGDIFLEDNITDTPDVDTHPDYPDYLDDDRPLTVSNVTVNEASPYAVFTVGGADGQFFQLTPASGTATLNTDFGDTVDPDLQYFDGADWQDYTPGDFLEMDGTSMLVRTAIINDALNEVSETFTVTATNVGGTGTAGTGTIVDQGNGNIFLETNDTATPNVDTDPGYPDYLDDDRPFTVSSVTVNEASPFVVFSVGGVDDQWVQLSLASGTATLNTDFGDTVDPDLQYFDGADWVDYTPGDFIQLDGVTLLVRTAIINDTLNEVSETFTLTATNVGGANTAGTGTIVDQADGVIFLPDNETDTPNVDTDPGYPDALDDDRPLTVTGGTYNEASPYGVFSVDGAVGQLVSLDLLEDEAIEPEDYGTDVATTKLEVLVTGVWTAYEVGDLIAIPAGGTLLVRTAINNDTINEVSEDFALQATNVGGTDFTGTGTIVDQADGDIFLEDNITDTPDVDTHPDYPDALDDDRPLTVTGGTYNEASPYGVFSVDGAVGQLVSLDLLEDEAIEPEDYGTDVATTKLEVLVTGVWTAYEVGDLIAIPAGGTLLVRTAINNDTINEVSEDFALQATNVGGTDFTGTGTIVDQADGDIFLEDNITDTPDVDTHPDYPDALDDDRPLTVTGGTYNEASPYGVFSVDGAVGQLVSLDLLEDEAIEPEDYGTDVATTKLEVLVTGVWTAYEVGDLIAIPAGGTLLVRTAINNDTINEVSEDFALQATNVGGTDFTGTGTIVDQADGDIFLEDNITDTPDVDTHPDYPDALDDDRPLTVTGGTYNEASPYGVFSVDGAVGQLVSLDLLEDEAIEPEDYGTDVATTKLEVLVTGVWTAYEVGDLIAIPAGGTLLVRTAINNDTINEVSEDFALQATNVGGTDFTGTGTIVDQADGDIFLEDNITDTPDVDTHPDYPDALDDDRPLTVTGGTYNEASPYGVFSVDGAVGQLVSLDLLEDEAIEPEDYGTDVATTKLEVLVTGVWTAYEVGDLIAIPAGGTLLVRTAINNDTINEVSEDFALQATNVGGTDFTGTGTIVDQADGDIFLEDNITDTPDVDTHPDYPDALDDDRPLTVTGGTYNEASPYGVFSVDGAVGQLVSLDLLEDEALEPEDYGTDVATTKLEVLVTGVWTAYEVGDLIAIPAGGTLLVRTAINNDTINEVSEDFALQATNVGGTDFTGTGTIVDQADGDIFLEDNITDTPDVDTHPDYPDALDDDRPLAVNSITVNEGSPYAVFKVTAAEGSRLARLVVGDVGDTATFDVDYGTVQASNLQYYDGAAWQPYVTGTYVPLLGAGPSQLLVRTSPVQDGVYEGAEVFTLSAFNGGNSEFQGFGTIVDDGTGDYYDDDDTGDPDPTPPPLDDDRPPIANLAGSGLIFDGTSYGETTLGDPAGHYDTAVTMEVWMRRDLVANVPIGDEVILAKGPDWGLRYNDTTGNLEFFTEGLSNAVLAFDGTDIFDGDFHHLAAVYDSVTETKRLYVDGALVAEATSVTGTLDDTSSTFRIAANAAVADPLANLALGELWNGELDEVRVWNVVRDEGQLEALKDTLLNGYEFGLVHYWRLDEGTGNLTNDLLSTAPANQIELFGTPQWFKPEETVDRMLALSGMELDIQLAGYELGGDAVIAYIIGLPSEGTLYQRLPNGERGDEITAGVLAAGQGVGANPGQVRVTDSLGRVIYVAPDSRVTDDHLEVYAFSEVSPDFDEFDYLVKKQNFQESAPETTTIDLETVSLLGGTSVLFNRASSHYALTPNLRSGFLDNAVTIEVWFRADGDGIIVTELGQATLDIGWQNSQIEVVDIDGTNAEVRVRVWNLPEATSTLLRDGLLVGTITYGTWNHAAVRYNPVARRLDGALNGVPTVTQISGDRQTPWETIIINQWNQASRAGLFYAFGARDRQHMGSGAPTTSTYFNNHFTGAIDEVRIWNEAIPDDRLAKDYTAFVDGEADNLVALYRFDEPSGNIIAAVDQPSRNAVLYNNPTRIRSIANLNVTDVSWGESKVIEVPGYENANTVYTATITRMPIFGALYQFNELLPNNRGDRITNVPTDVTDARRRVVFEPANSSTDPDFGSRYDSFEYFTDGAGDQFGTRRHRFRVSRSNTAPEFGVDNDALTGAVEDTPFVIDHADLVAALHLTDADSTDLQFRVERVWAGSLAVGANAITAKVTTIADGESFTWTPPAWVNRDNADGVVAAFAVIAYDGRDFSTETRTVYVDIDPVDNDPIAEYPGSALRFNGTGSYVYTQNLRPLFRTDAVTIEVWFRADGPGVIVSERARANATGWTNSQLEVTNTGAVRAAVRGLGGPTGLYLGNVEWGTWNHAVVRYDEANLRLDGFLNGVQQPGEFTFGQERDVPWRNGFTGLFYGFGLADATNLGSGAYFEGLIGEVRLWNVARGNADLTSSVPEAITGDELGLAVWYKFDEAAGTEVIDYGPYRTGGPFGPTPGQASLNATLISSPAWIENWPTTLVGVPVKIRLQGYHPDGLPLSYHIVTVPGAGTLNQWNAGNPGNVITAGGAVTDPEGRVFYTPTGSVDYTTSFTYRVHDNRMPVFGQSAAETVNVRVVDDPDELLLFTTGEEGPNAPPVDGLDERVRMIGMSTYRTTGGGLPGGGENGGTGEPELSQERLRLEFAIDRRQAFVVEYSDDLATWEPVVDVWVDDTRSTLEARAIVAEVDAVDAQRFVRVRLLP